MLGLQPGLVMLGFKARLFDQDSNAVNITPKEKQTNECLYLHIVYSIVIILNAEKSVKGYLVLMRKFMLHFRS